jgi:CRISPR system Cascade subunit CasE
MDPYGGALVLYVQSASGPDWSRLPAGFLASLSDRPNPEMRALTELEAVTVGGIARSRLRANPTRRVDTKSVDGQRRHGRRVPHRADGRCLEWLVRKGQAHGFDLVRGAADQLDVALVHEPARRGRREGATLTLEGARFDGRLRITDPAAFRAAVIHGIGPGKAYGFGLLSFAPE